MNATMIQISLDPELARVYETASLQDRERIRFWISLMLRDMANPKQASLAETMDRMSDEAGARGLTPEMLEQLLKDDN